MFWGTILLFCFHFSYAADTYQLAYQLSEDTGDFSHFQELLKTQRFGSIEEFLSLWKQERPEYYSNYVMAYRSRSLQQASPTHPRIIMFSKNADFVVSFNSHTDHRGVDNLEMMRFNHEKNSFEFYELGFINGKAEFSAPNPQKCLECHQGASRTTADPRPNWEPYNAWLGFYGSIDDSTQMRKQSFPREPFYNPATDSFLLEEFDNEPFGFETFWNETRPNDRRYSFLDKVINKSYNEATINGDFTNRLATLNNRRIARLIKENKPLYDYIKWTVWAYGVCGQSLETSIPVREWLAQVTPRKPVSSLETTTQLVNCINIDGLNCINAPLSIVVQPQIRLTDMIHLIVEPFNQDTEDWSMDFKTGGRFAAFERFGLANDPRPPLRAAIQRVFADDPDFQNLSCADAKAKSLQNFGDLEKVKSFYNTMNTQTQGPTTPAPLIRRCISCHVDDVFSSIPFIPFNDPAQLKTRLSQSGYKRGTLLDEIRYRTGAHAGIDEQMPPRGLPSESLRKDLIDYLEGL